MLNACVCMSVLSSIQWNAKAGRQRTGLESKQGQNFVSNGCVCFERAASARFVSDFVSVCWSVLKSGYTSHIRFSLCNTSNGNKKKEPYLPYQSNRRTSGRISENTTLQTPRKPAELLFKLEVSSEIHEKLLLTDIRAGLIWQYTLWDIFRHICTQQSIHVYE